MPFQTPLPPKKTPPAVAAPAAVFGPAVPLPSATSTRASAALPPEISQPDFKIELFEEKPKGVENYVGNHVLGGRFDPMSEYKGARIGFSASGRQLPINLRAEQNPRLQLGYWLNRDMASGKYRLTYGLGAEANLFLPTTERASFGETRLNAGFSLRGPVARISVFGQDMQLGFKIRCETWMGTQNMGSTIKVGGTLNY